MVDESDVEAQRTEANCGRRNKSEDGSLRSDQTGRNKLSDLRSNGLTDPSHNGLVTTRSKLNSFSNPTFTREENENRIETETIAQIHS